VLLIPKRHGRTDRQTDRRLTVASPRSALASRGKNYATQRTTARFVRCVRHYSPALNRKRLFSLVYITASPLHNLLISYEQGPCADEWATNQLDDTRLGDSSCACA